MGTGRLTARQLKYARLVADGMSEKDAVLEAGYSPVSRKQTLLNLRDNPRVQEQIHYYKSHQGEPEELVIADSEDRQRLWTAIMNDPSFSGNIRLEASKLLGKAQGDFTITKKVEHSSEKPIIFIPKASPKEWEEFWEDNDKE